jgi:hypothetical protein
MYLFRQGWGEGGELTREKVKGSIVIPTSPVNKLYETPVKTIFRVWCLLFSPWEEGLPPSQIPLLKTAKLSFFQI